MSTAWSLTLGGVSTRNPRPPAEPSWLGTGINPETWTGAEIERPGDSSVANTVVLGAWSMPTTLSGEILKSSRPFQWRVGEKNLVTHLEGLSNLESISIDNRVDARDKVRGEDGFPSKYPATLCMRMVSGCRSLDMIRRETWICSWAQGCVCSSHDFFGASSTFTPSNVKYATWLDTTVKAPLTFAMWGRYSSYYLQWQASQPSGIDTIITSAYSALIKFYLKVSSKSPRRRHGSTSNSVTTCITELKEAISEVSRALIHLGIPKDVNAYAQTRYDSCMVCCHLLPLVRRQRSYSLNEPNSVGIFTNAELLPTLLKYVISDGEANQTILDSKRSLRAIQVSNQCMQHSCQHHRIRWVPPWPSYHLRR